VCSGSRSKRGCTKLSKLTEGTSIPELGSEDSYTYLGLQQLLGIRDNDSRKQIEKVLSRVHKVCKSSLSS
jgi:hypothetical protein